MCISSVAFKYVALDSTISIHANRYYCGAQLEYCNCGKCRTRKLQLMHMFALLYTLYTYTHTKYLIPAHSCDKY